MIILSKRDAQFFAVSMILVSLFGLICQHYSNVSLLNYISMKVTQYCVAARITAIPQAVRSTAGGHLEHDALQHGLVRRLGGVVLAQVEQGDGGTCHIHNNVTT